MRLARLEPNRADSYRLPMATFACACGRTIGMRWRPAGSRFAVMEAAGRGTDKDYLVIAKSYGQFPTLWKWEIQRRSKPLGIRLDELGFKSEQSAMLAGQKALAELLEGIRQEEDALARMPREPLGAKSDGSAEAENTHAPTPGSPALRARLW